MCISVCVCVFGVRVCICDGLVYLEDLSFVERGFFRGIREIYCICICSYI